MKKKNLVALGLTGLFATALPFAIAEQPANISYAADNDAPNYANLEDGEYSLPTEIFHAHNPNAKSMADGAIDKNSTLIVRDGKYFIRMTFKPLHFLGQYGYLGDFKPYNSANTLYDAKIVSFYGESEKDSFFETYTKKFPERTAYPKVFEFEISKEMITSSKLQMKAQVFVPVMESISDGSGTQDCKPTFDFSKMTVIKKYENELETLKNNAKNEISKLEKLTDEEKKDFLDKITAAKDENSVEDIKKQAKDLNASKNKETNLTYVTLTTKDGSAVTPHVRRAIDSNAHIITKDGKKFLVVTYYSKEQDGIYDTGLREVFYSYDKEEGADDSNVIRLTPKVIENGKMSNGEYTISQVEIPIDNHDKIHLYGSVLVNPYTNLQDIYSGEVSWTNSSKPTINKVEQPKFLLVKPSIGTKEKKEGDANQPYDFEKDGVHFSPYNGADGTKFKLADGRYALEAIFERKSLAETNIRHIKYTLDGSEPTMDSKDANINFSNKSAHVPDKYYRIFISPMEDISNFSKDGGDVTLKVKAFNADGTVSSNTQTFVFPFEKQTIDEVKNNFPNYDNINATLSSNRRYALTDNTTFNIEQVTDETLLADIEYKTKKLNISDYKVMKVTIKNKDNSEFVPSIRGGWDSEYYPLLKLDLMGLNPNKDSQAYLYGDNLKLLSTYVSGKKLSLPLYSNETYVIVTNQDSKKLLDENIKKLEEKIKEAEKLIEQSELSNYTVNLQHELQSAKKTLGRKSKQLSKILSHLDTIEYYENKIKNHTNDVQGTYYKEQAKKFDTILSSDIIKNLTTNEQLEKLNKLKEDMNNSLDNIEQLKSILKNLEAELNSLSYKYPSQDFSFEIRKYHDKNSTSMANSVFENSGRLIFTPDKTYAELSLKTMSFAGIKAHLLELILFKNNLDGERFSSHSINLYSDLAPNGTVASFDKKILVELDKLPKNEYKVRVDNDGMGGAKPEALFVITSEINRPEVLTDEQKAEKERLEREKAEKELAEKERLEREKAEKELAEKERLEREKTEKEQAEKERLEREKTEKELAEKERLEREKAEKELAEKERLEREKAERELAEKERLEREKTERELIEKEQTEHEKTKNEQDNSDKLENKNLLPKTGLGSNSNLLLASSLVLLSYIVRRKRKNK